MWWVTELRMEWRLVVGSEIAKVISYQRETSSTPFAWREKASASHHTAGHLFHTTFFTTLVLKPNLQYKTVI